MRFQRFHLLVAIVIMTAIQGHSKMNWTLRNPSPSLSEIRSIAWTGTQFVAVGEGGILTSPDGNHWSVGVNAEFYGFYSVSWVGNQLIILGRGQDNAGVTVGKILTSHNGVDWIERKSGTENYLKSVVWTGKQYVVVGEVGTVLTSPDGEAWTKRDASTRTDLQSVGWLDGRLLAIGESNMAIKSYDGVSWDSVGFENTGFAMGKDTQYVAMGKKVYACSKGRIWDPAGGQPVESVVWTGSQLVGVGYKVEYGKGVILSSKDGATWKESDGNYSALHSVILTGSNLFAVGAYGSILSSPDGVKWDLKTSGPGSALLSVVWTGSQFVAVGDTIMTSPDGISWTARSAGTQKFQSVTWTGRQLVAVGHDSVMYSADGVVWSSGSPGFQIWSDAVTWAGNQLILVGVGGEIWTSPENGIWAKQNSRTKRYFADVVWTGQNILALGSDTVSISRDGVNWKAFSTGIKEGGLFSVAWMGNQYVAVGTSGKILTSVDGSVWTPKNSGTNSTLYSVEWTGKQLVAFGQNGTMLTSPDGEIWTSQRTGVRGVHLAAGISANGQIIAVGISGAILSAQEDPISGIIKTTMPNRGPWFHQDREEIRISPAGVLAGNWMRGTIYSLTGRKVAFLGESKEHGTKDAPLPVEGP